MPDLEGTPVDELTARLDARGGAILAALAALCGGSRLFAAEALALAEIDPRAETAALDAEAKYRLFDAAAGLARIIGEGGEGGTVIMDGKEDLPRDVFPLPMATATGRDLHFESLDEAIVEYSREREIALERRSLHHLITSALDREERNLRTTVMKIERDRGDEAEPDRLEQRANTILASLHLVRRGMTTVQLPDPWGGGPVDIELDPVLDGPANAERLFARARKLRAGAQVTLERLSLLHDRLNEIAAEREYLASIGDIRALRDLAARYARRSALTAEQEEMERFPRRFTSVSGLEIIVGRNDAENDELIHWARRTDVWLHAQGVAGSHVILRAPGKQMPDHRSIEQAASIAAFYSKAKTSAIAPVAWTLLKYVVKRKGQGPGQVTYTREKVVFVEPARMGGKSEGKE
jgi:predicted ribosome quality control (RQC) complex YloA/Tae2 family protein